MTRQIPKFLAVLIAIGLASGVAFAQSGAPDGRVAPRGDRLFGVDVTTPQDGDFDAAFVRALEVGSQVVEIPMLWTDIEVAPGVYDPEPNWLAIANQYYPQHEIRIVLNVNPIDTTVLHLPADLVGRSMDDPLVISRYANVLDWVFEQIPDLTLDCVAIGNEVDVYLGEDPAAYEAYRTFFRAARKRVRSHRAGTPVGVKSTYVGLMETAPKPLRRLNLEADTVLVTYYPLDSSFRVRAPGVVHQDMKVLVGKYPSTKRPIRLLECGYPSGDPSRGPGGSAPTGSTPELQAAFIREMFRAWDTHRRRIALVKFTWMHDSSPASVATLQQYYGVSHPAFRDYLATLGLRTYAGAGEDKPAFTALAEEASRRGW